MYKSIPLSSLWVGAQLASPIYDVENRKLLAAGLEVSEALIERLRRRGVQSVVIEQKDLLRLMAFQAQGTASSALPDRKGLAVHTERLDPRLSRALDNLTEQTNFEDHTEGGTPFLAEVAPRGAAAYDRAAMDEFFEQHEATLSSVDQFLLQVSQWRQPDAVILERTAQQALATAAVDFDLFVCLGANPVMMEYPSRHSLHTGMVAIAIGAKMDLPVSSLRDLMAGCLIHDVGMRLLRPEAYQTRRVLDLGDFVEITRHPLLTFDVLETKFAETTAAARMVAYQIHERCNGTGYPRGRTHAQIHPLARIAAVADAFVALVSHRPHRAGMISYHAVVKLLQDVHQGLYDPEVVRALLHTVSLFPIGSCVRLSNGQMGRVLRANDQEYRRPVVEVHDPSRPQAVAGVIDLAVQRDLEIVQALARID